MFFIEIMASIATMAHSVYVRNQFSHSAFEIWAGHLYAGALRKAWRL